MGTLKRKKGVDAAGGRMKGMSRRSLLMGKIAACLLAVLCSSFVPTAIAFCTVEGPVSEPGDVNPTGIPAPSTFAVEYCAHSGTGTLPATAAYEYGSAIVVADPGNLAREGYFFAGWYSNTAVSVLYQPGDTVIPDELNPSGLEVNPGAGGGYRFWLHAKWANVAFNAAGADNESAYRGLALSVNQGTTIMGAQGFPSDPFRQGYIFKGWAMDDGALLTASTVMPLNPVTLVATWVEAENVVVGTTCCITAKSFILSAEAAHSLLGQAPSELFARLVALGSAKAWLSAGFYPVNLTAIDIARVNQGSLPTGEDATPYYVTYHALGGNNEEISIRVLMMVEGTERPTITDPLPLTDGTALASTMPVFSYVIDETSIPAQQDRQQQAKQEQPVAVVDDSPSPSSGFTLSAAALSLLVIGMVMLVGYGGAYAIARISRR